MVRLSGPWKFSLWRRSASPQNVSSVSSPLPSFLSSADQTLSLLRVWALGPGGTVRTVVSWPSLSPRPAGGSRLRIVQSPLVPGGPFSVSRSFCLLGVQEEGMVIGSQDQTDCVIGHPFLGILCGQR